MDGKLKDASTTVDNSITKIKTVSAELQNVWKGKVSDKFFVNMESINSNICTINTHLSIYNQVTSSVSDLKDIDKQIEALEKRKAMIIAQMAEAAEGKSVVVMDDLSTVEKQIQDLKEKKEKTIKATVALLEGISSGNIFLGIVNARNIAIGINTFDFSGISTVGPTLSYDGNKPDSLNININTKDNPLLDSVEPKKVAPTKIEEVDLGSGKYMTDEDWENSYYFKKEDFKCKCGGKYCDGYPAEISKTLIEDLNKIRVYYNKPVVVSSGLRCKQHNANQDNSSPTSNHLKGRAVDIYIDGVNKYELLNYVKTTYAQHDSDTYTNDSNMGNAIHFGVRDIER